MPLHVPDPPGDPVRREDREPLLMRRHEHDHLPRARLGPVLGVKRERRLVAMMAVRDQQLAALIVGRAFPVARAARRRARGRARAQAARRGSPSWSRKIGSSCVRVARKSRRRPSLIPACVRSCGRTTPLVVRLQPQRARRRRSACARPRPGRRTTAPAPTRRAPSSRTSMPSARQSARSRAACSSESGRVR